MTTPSDAELLRRWRAGELEAGSTLASRHFTSVFRFFRRKLDDDAEDLTQRTFLACQRGDGGLNDTASVRAYLLGIARNLLLQDARAEGRRTRRHAALAAQPRPTATSPSAHAAAQEEHHLLLSALRTLPLDQQITIELHYWEEMTTAEIATVLDVAQGTIKWRLSQARGALRDAVEAMAADPALRKSTVTSLEAWAKSLRALADE